MTQPSGPQSFLNAPGFSSYRPAATRLEHIEEARATYAPVAAPALLSITAASYCYPTKPFMTQLAGMKSGGRVQIVAPAQKGGTWYIDTRARPGVGNALPAPGKKPLFRITPRIPAIHFAGVLRRHFALGKKVAPDYYELVPVAAPVRDTTRCVRGHLLTTDNLQARGDGSRMCRTCNDLRKAAARPVACPVGHAYTDANTLYDKLGRMRCRLCAERRAQGES
jgi:hypothetical protein